MQILDAGRQAVQRPELLAVASGCFGALRELARVDKIRCRDRVDRRNEGLDAADRCFHELDRGDFLRPNPPPHFDRRQRQQFIRL